MTCNPIDGARLDSVGRAVPGVELRVVSLETGDPLPAGEVGEIQAQSNSVMAGYLPAEDTAAAFLRRLVPHRRRRLPRRRRLAADHRPGQGDDQGPRFPGRAGRDRGRAARSSGGADCAVFGVPDAANGEAVVAAVDRRAPGAQVEADELIDLVGERLASYKRPSEVVFVPEIPRLPSGKVLRRVLKERHGRTSDE